MNCRLLLLSFSVFMSIIMDAQKINWSNEQKISTASRGNIRPRLLALNDQKGIIVWGSELTKKITYATWQNDVLSTPKLLDMGTTQAFVTNWASLEIAGEDNVVYIVYKAEPADTAAIFMHVSTDYGETFSKPIVVQEGLSLKVRFPGIAIDQNRQAIISYMKFFKGWGDPSFMCRKSIDFGKSFGNEVLVSDSLQGEACDCCPVAMTTDQNDLAVLFRNNDNNIRDMTAVLSTDGGISYEGQYSLDTLSWKLNSCPSSAGDALFSKNVLHTTWMSGRTGRNKVYYSTWNRSTKKIDFLMPMDHILGRNLAQANPRIAGNQDTVFIIWSELISNSEILMNQFIYSKNSVQSQYSTINVTTAGHQINPDVKYRNGKLYTVWEDDGNNSIVMRIGTITNTTHVKTETKNFTWFIRDNKLYYNGGENLDVIIYNLSGMELARFKSYDQHIEVNNFPEVFFIKILYRDGTQVVTKMMK